MTEQTKKDRIEALSEILNEIGVSSTEYQVAQIVEGFSLHIEMEAEMSSYQHISYSERTCTKCASLTDKLKDAERQIGVYQQSVKSRRKAEDVWIEGDTVMYK